MITRIRSIRMSVELSTDSFSFSNSPRAEVTLTTYLNGGAAFRSTEVIIADDFLSYFDQAVKVCKKKIITMAAGEQEKL